jgi:hypothetical protein
LVSKLKVEISEEEINKYLNGEKKWKYKQRKSQPLKFF